jgi:hypothetical protein
MPPGPGTRIPDYDGTFFSGVKSDTDPAQIPLGYYWMGINTLNVGGSISCRPGYRCVATLPDGNLQAGFCFRPIEGLEQLLAVVDGKVYVADWPFSVFRQVPGLQFSPYAKQIYWVQATQSAERLGTGPAPAIEVIPPRAVIILQDGGFSAPGWYDGSSAGHLAGDEYGIPAGSSMEWVGDRLWVARDHQLFASDISNPFSFREAGYLGGQVSFFFRSDITAMVVTPSTEAPQLMVFTDANGSLIQANIRERDEWLTTPNFQEEVIGVGTASERSVVSHYGRIVWFSPAGVAFYDPAMSGKLTTRLPVRDNEMMFSKSVLSEDTSTVAVGAYGQFLMVSVPAEDSFNRHTWVLNHASLATLSDDSGPSWAGYWTGTRPVEWIYGQIVNAERIYYVSVDYDGKNRVWEAFIPDRLDNQCPITWGVLTRGYFGATASVHAKPPGTRCRLAWVEMGFAGIEEDFNIGVFYAGSTRGAFRQIMNKLVRVDKGSISHDEPLDANTTVYAFKPQSRMLSTEDANQQAANDALGACGVEQEDLDNIDRSFQLLIVGHGPATLKWVNPIAFLVPEDLSGEATACEDETPHNAVRFDGVGTKQPTYADAVAELTAHQMAEYTAAKTNSLTQDGYFAVGVGFAESIVSQAAADRVADIIANKSADNELNYMLPVITSMGLENPSSE